MKRVMVVAVVAATFSALAMPAASAQVVALGASNTRGKGVKPAEAFPAQIGAILRANGRPMQVRNAGVDGDTSAGMLARLDRVLPSGTRVVLLQIGGNDNRRGIDNAQRAANIAAIRQKLQARGISIVDADGAVTGALRSGMRQADGIHLTPEGHATVARQLANAIQ
jgi:acyl-CoA thioesterase I